MSFSLQNEEIDYDKLIDYELSCLRDDDVEEEEEIIIKNNITKDYSYDLVLEKISESHEEFYKTCFYNATCDDNEDEVQTQNLDDSFDSRSKKILKSFNITYEDFVMTLPKISSELEKSLDSSTSPNTVNFKVEEKNNPITEAWINHENVLKQINAEKWNQYDSFLNKFSERCTSSRLIINKQLEDQLSEENKRRQIQQSKMESELSLLDQRYKLEEAENKLRIMEIESEIEEEKKVMAKLQNDVKEVINVKYEKAAIMIQKVFRRYRIRKRIGAQIDEVREKARKTLFNKKLIMSEGENQRKRARELRKWKKSRDKDDKANKIKVKIDIEKGEDFLENKGVAGYEDIGNQGNNSNVFEYDKTDVVDHMEYENEKVDINCGELERNEEKISKSCFDKEYGAIKSVQESSEIENNTCLEDDFNKINKRFLKDEESIVSHQSENVNFLPIFITASPINEITKVTEECTQDVEQRNDVITHVVNVTGSCNDGNKEIMTTMTSIENKVNSEDKVLESGINNNRINYEEGLTVKEINKVKFNNKINVDRKSAHKSIENNECTVESKINKKKNKSIVESNKMEEKNKSIADSKINEEKIKSVEESKNSEEDESVKDYKLKETSGSTLIGDESAIECIKNDFLEHSNNKSKEKILQSSRKDKKNLEKLQPIDDPRMNKECVLDVGEVLTCLGDSSVESSEIIYKGELVQSNEEDKLKVEKDIPKITYDEKVTVNKKDVSNREAVLAEINKNTFLHNSDYKSEVKGDQSCVENKIKLDLSKNTHEKKDEDLNNELIHDNFEYKEKKDDKNEEVFFNEIFCDNKSLVELCLNWLTYTNERKAAVIHKDIHSDVPNVDLNVPRHLYQDSKIILDPSSGNVTINPSNEDFGSTKSLIVKDSRLVSIEGIKEQCTELEFLAVNNTYLRFLNCKDMMGSLVYLNLDMNKLEWMYFGGDKCNNLVHVSCKDNDLSVLPPGAFRNCEALTILDLSNNNFLNIVNIFRDNKPLQKLSYLNLSGNVLSCIDSLAYHCPYLTHLSISNNHLNIWLQEDFQFLIECNLSYNSFSKVCRLSNSPLLIKLDLSNNSIDSMEDLCQSWLPCLSELIVDSNKLTELPQLLFPILQTLSVKKNYITDISNVEERCKACPLISTVDVRQNPINTTCSSYKFKDIVIDDNNIVADDRIPCPSGEFAMACYDFVDSIQNKSKIFEHNLKSSSSIEMLHKHHFHFYRFVRDVAEDFFKWMILFLYSKNFSEGMNQNKSKNLILSQREVEAVFKIQAFWKGYRIRQWFKQILKNIKFETEKSFEIFVPSELPEFDEDYFLRDWDSNTKLLSAPKEAWTNSNVCSALNTSYLKKTESNTGIGDVIVASCETSSRSSSIPYGHSGTLGRKNMEIMKEWGFEDPNSAKWMQRRANRLRGKSEKITKSTKPRRAPSTHIQVAQSHRPMKMATTEVVPFSTVTLQPPGSAQSNNSKEKICAWLLDNDCSVELGSRNKSFLPVIKSNIETNKILTDSIRRDSLTTKLPPINMNKQ